MTDQIHPWIEPELEARIVALIVGEASDFEREELERICAERSEVAAFRRRMEEIHGQIRDAVKGGDGDGSSRDAWQLPGPRREALLISFQRPVEEEEKKSFAARKESVEFRSSITGAKWSRWARAGAAVAACLMVGLFVAAMIALTGIRYSSRTVASTTLEMEEPTVLRDYYGEIGFKGHAEATRGAEELEGYPSGMPELAKAEPSRGTKSLEQLKSILKDSSSNFGRGDSDQSAPLIDPISPSGGVSIADTEELVRLERQIPESGLAGSPVIAATGISSPVQPENVATGPSRSAPVRPARSLGRGVKLADLEPEPVVAGSEIVLGKEVRVIEFEGFVAEEQFADRPGAETAKVVISRNTGEPHGPFYKAPVDSSVTKLKEESLGYEVERGYDSSFEFRGMQGGDDELLASVPVEDDHEQSLFPGVAEKNLAGDGSSIVSRGGGAVESPKIGGFDVAELEVILPASEGQIISDLSALTAVEAQQVEDDAFGGDVLAASIQPKGAGHRELEIGQIMDARLADQGRPADQLGEEIVELGLNTAMAESRPEIVLRERSISLSEDVAGLRDQVDPGALAPEAEATLAPLRDNVARQWVERAAPAREIRRKQEEVAGELANARISLDLEEATLEEALDVLQRKLSEADSLNDGDIEFELQHTPGQEGEIAGANPITLRLDDVSVHQALKYVTEISEMKYRLEEGRVAVIPRWDAGTGLFLREYSIPKANLQRLWMEVRAADLENGNGNPFGLAVPMEPGSKSPVRELLEGHGISFAEGASVYFNPDNDILIVRNTLSQHELMEAIVEQETDRARHGDSALSEVATTDEPFSTFSLHVGDVSFKLAKSALAEGKWPDVKRVRIEEFVNAFDYADPMPSTRERIACVQEQAAHPFLQQRNLLRVSMRTAAEGRSGGTPLRLTLLLDASGSMEREDRRRSVDMAMAQLAAQLREGDLVSMITFARTPRLVAENVSAQEAHGLVARVRELPSEGGTNLEAALRLAMEKAIEHREGTAQNRIVLLTDGAANLGDADPAGLAGLIEEMRTQGIAFDAAGIVADGLNDEILEALTRKGDGRYYLLDRPEDADERFANQIAGALRPAAKNVKVQVEFNPDRVKSYKLLGFEKHRLEKEDFRNDKVDAAEMAAAEAGVALYHYELIPDGEGDVGFVSVRFLDMSLGRMVERRWPIPFSSGVPALDQASDSMRLASVAALTAAKLRGDVLGDFVDWEWLANSSRSFSAEFQQQERVSDLVTLISQARGVAKK